MDKLTSFEIRTINQMQAAHDTKADKEYRKRAVAYLRRAASAIEMGDAEPVEMSRDSSNGVYDTYGVSWITVRKE